MCHAVFQAGDERASRCARVQATFAAKYQIVITAVVSRAAK